MTTKEEMLYDQIKQDILDNKFEPGTIMVERKLTEMYQVSRSPVRYALRQLVRDGLLSGEPGKGILVPEYSLEDILEVYDLLEILQIYALQMSIRNYSDASVDKLRHILDQTASLTGEETLADRMKWDIEFHNFIIHCANNKRLDMIFQLLVNQKRRFDVTSFHDVEHGRITNEQHEKVYEAIKARDLDGAIAALKAHEQYIKQYYIDKLIKGRYNVSV